MKKGFLGSILSIFVFILTFMSFTTNTMAAGTTEYACSHNSSHKCVDLKGYIWGADNTPFGGVGWINMNNTSNGSNTSSGVDYKVSYDRNDGTLHGYAYSENYGYIKFGDFTEGSGKYPVSATCKSSTNTDANCNAQIVSVNGSYKMVGYARFCFVYKSGCSGTLRSTTELGGYDGWIGFSGTNFSVTYGTTSNLFSGYAWSGGNSDKSNKNYGEGSGWIKMNPNGGGLSCVVISGADCISDNVKPSVTLTASPNPAKYNQDVTLSWTITDIPSGCTAKLSSTPSNSTWNNLTISSGAGNLASGSVNIGKLTNATTFSLSCTYGTETGSADVMVDLLNYTPVVTISAPTSKYYGQDVDVDYSVTNIPYGCNGKLTNNGNVIQDNINVTSNGTPSYKYTNTIKATNLTSTANFEFSCTDDTPPSPNRVGSATTKTTVTVPTPTVSFSVKDTNTGSTSTIPCSNSGVTIVYSTKDVKSGSCAAQVNYAGTNSDWGSSTSITENDYPTNHTVTTGAVTDTGAIVYGLQCKKLDGTPWTAGKSLTRSCTAGTLSVTPAASCVTPSQMVDINYVGSGFTSGSCTMSWKNSPNDKINQSSFNLHYTYPAKLLTVGTTYTFEVSGCKESAYPGNSPMSANTTVSVQNTCGSTTGTGTGTGTSCTGSSHRCNSSKGPIFKEF